MKNILYLLVPVVASVVFLWMSTSTFLYLRITFSFIAMIISICACIITVSFIPINIIIRQRIKKQAQNKKTSDNSLKEIFVKNDILCLIVSVLVMSVSGIMALASFIIYVI